MKNMAYKCKVNRREELHYKIFDAERCMHFEYHKPVSIEIWTCFHDISDWE
jgi:hypothetical protein